MNSKNITSLIKMQLKDMSKWNITSNNLTGTDSYQYTYSYSTQKLYVMVPNEDSLTKANNLINEVMEGNILDRKSTRLNSSH